MPLERLSDRATRQRADIESFDGRNSVTAVGEENLARVTELLGMEVADDDAFARQNPVAHDSSACAAADSRGHKHAVNRGEEVGEAGGNDVARRIHEDDLVSVARSGGPMRVHLRPVVTCFQAGKDWSVSRIRENEVFRPRNRGGLRLDEEENAAVVERRVKVAVTRGDVEPGGAVIAMELEWKKVLRRLAEAESRARDTKFFEMFGEENESAPMDADRGECGHPVAETPVAEGDS